MKTYAEDLETLSMVAEIARLRAVVERCEGLVVKWQKSLHPVLAEAASDLDDVLEELK